METLALSLNTTHTSLYLSSRPQTHLIKSPFFPYKTTKYGLCNTKNFNFFTLKVTCKLTKTSKDSVKTKNLIVGPADKAPLLSEKSSGSSESDSQTKPGKKKATGKMLLKRYSKKVLSVLSNLSLAIGEMFTIAGLMAIGTFIDQGEAPGYYFQKYPEENPVFGFLTWRWILPLGFDHMFTSPIFLGILVLLGASLMACTSTTQIPIVKVARRWSFVHSPDSIKKQEFSDTLPSASVQDLGVILMGAGYEVFLKGPSLYAFKGLAGRFAPIGVHFALLLIMAGGTLSAAGSFRGSVTVPQGLNFVAGDVLEPSGFLSTPSNAFSTEVHVNKFYMEYYDSGEVSQFYTDLSLYDLEGKEVLRKTIKVNDPLRYGGITIYQTDWSISALQVLKDDEGPFNLAMAPLQMNGGDKKLYGTILPVGSVDSPNVKGISMLARDLQSVVLYDQEGKFAGIRRPSSKLPIEIDGSKIVVLDAIGSSGLNLKTDPGVPVVYAGFGALMLTTCISFLSHSQVRGICVCGDVGIATSSRDRTIRFWTLNQSNNRDYVLSKILLGHSSFVVPLAWISPNEEFPEGRIVSGGMDKLLFVWNLLSAEKCQTLNGHQQQVTGITLDGSDIISSSVDCTLRRWRGGQQVEVWEAHNAAIQAVMKLPSGELITGSSDTTVKLWNGKTCLHTFSGHSDTVRSLAVMPGLGFLSASHDGSIRLWALSGEVLLEMVGHTSIVYSVDAHVSGLIVSGSEDCFAKIWKDGVCLQSIEHPGCVWDAKFLGNGDIVTTCSDGVVRVWTVHHDRIADPQEAELYASLLSEYRCSRKKVGGLKLNELPGLEALQTPGTRDGQTKVVREGENGVAYAWNMIESKWDKIGEVVDGPDDSMKRPVLNGNEYDYVFDVDIGDGEPIRKLPYNRSDSPYDTADMWLLKENLPLSYRQQIVEFILKNSGQKDFSFDSSFRDPFTGSSAYVPGGPSNLSAVSARPTFKHIPKKGMLVFDAAQFDGILKKISEFNSTLISDLGKKNLALTELEISRLAAITKILKDTSHYHSSKFSDVDIALLLQLLNSWPVEMIFPVIDIVRMIVLHPDGAALLLKHVTEANDTLLELLRKVTTSPLPANLLTSIRAVTNLFRNSCYYPWLQKHRGEILDAFSSFYSSSNKNVQISYSTLILNYAVLLIEKKDEEGQSQVLSAALQIAEEENLEVDSKFRALVAIGSLMLDGLVKQIALDFDVDNVAKLAKASKEPKIAEIGADIELIVKQS